MEAVGISQNSLVSIFNGHSDGCYVCSHCLTTSNEYLVLLSSNPQDFLRCFITRDETWIYHNPPECKHSSKQWVNPGASPPEKNKMGLTAIKVIKTFFWEALSIIHIYYLDKGRTINSEYSANILDRFSKDLKKKNKSSLPRRKCLST